MLETSLREWGNAPELVDIRNPDHLSQYPFVRPVRDAAICAFDFLTEIRAHTIPQPDIADLSDGDIVRLGMAVNIIPESLKAEKTARIAHKLRSTHQEELAEAHWMQKATSSKCRITARAVNAFLSLHHRRQYEVSVWGSVDSSLEYFLMHEFSLIKHRKTGSYMAISVGNIFNHSSDPRSNRYKHNYTFPTYRGDAFQRSTTILLASKIDPIIGAMEEIEGAGGTWEDRTSLEYAQDSYPYVDRWSRLNVMMLSNFVKHWNPHYPEM